MAPEITAGLCDSLWRKLLNRLKWCRPWIHSKPCLVLSVCMECFSISLLFWVLWPNDRVDSLFPMWFLPSFHKNMMSSTSSLIFRSIHQNWTFLWAWISLYLSGMGLLPHSLLLSLAGTWSGPGSSSSTQQEPLSFLDILEVEGPHRASHRLNLPITSVDQQNDILTFEAIGLPVLIPYLLCFSCSYIFSLEIMLCLLLDSSKIYFSLALLCLVKLRGKLVWWRLNLLTKSASLSSWSAQLDHISQIPLQVLVAMCLSSFQ